MNRKQSQKSIKIEQKKSKPEKSKTANQKKPMNRLPEVKEPTLKQKIAVPKTEQKKAPCSAFGGIKKTLRSSEKSPQKLLVQSTKRKIKKILPLPVMMKP